MRRYGTILENLVTPPLYLPKYLDLLVFYHLMKWMLSGSSTFNWTIYYPFYAYFSLCLLELYGSFKCLHPSCPVMMCAFLLSRLWFHGFLANCIVKLSIAYGGFTHFLAEGDRWAKGLRLPSSLRTLPLHMILNGWIIYNSCSIRSLLLWRLLCPGPHAYSCCLLLISWTPSLVPPRSATSKWRKQLAASFLSEINDLKRPISVIIII